MFALSGIFIIELLQMVVSLITTIVGAGLMVMVPLGPVAVHPAKGVVAVP